jgi:hypothetical protein
VPAFAPDEYDEIYIVTIPRPLGKVKTLRYHYPEPPDTEVSKAIEPANFGGGQ